MKSLKKLIFSVFHFFWRALSVCRAVIGNLLLLLVLIVLLTIFFYDREQDVPDNAALILSLHGDLVIQKTETILSGRLLGEEKREDTLLKDVIDVIEYARDDQRINALVLDLRDMESAGLSKLQDIGAALLQFKNSGKKIFAFSDVYNQSQYYLAAHADHVYLHPMGGVFLTGYGLYRQYFKTALDKLLIQFHVFRVGTYKSALEPFLRDDMSEYDKEANLAWMSVLWDVYKTRVSELRGLVPDSIDGYINDIDVNLKRVEGDMARLALDYGLVDELKTRDEFADELVRLVGEDKAGRTFKQIRFDEYLSIVESTREKPDPDISKVGVIVARGIILDGKQPAGKIGGDTLSDLFRQARGDDSIAAVVLRIDSPGGSALASETIRQEIELTRQAGKPVVVSMSSEAASGGYWIASAADEIWAAPTTITGSIGIYAAFVTVDKTLDSIGVHTDGIGTTRLADALDPTRPLNSIVADSMQQIIESNYRRFIERVSAGRKMPTEDVEKIAQGRVWAGKTAVDLGLVDKLGGLQDAIGSAAELADIGDYDVIYVEQPLTAREQLIRRLNRFLTRAVRGSVGAPFNPGLRLYDKLSSDIGRILELNDPRGIYAYCLTCEIH